MSETKDMLSMSVRDFISETFAKAPTPGGGSVAAVTAALGTALGGMALNFTLGKKKFSDHAEYHEHLLKRLQRAKEMFSQLITDDVAAYTLYRDAMKMPDGQEKDSESAIALAAAINVPREVTKLARAVMDDLEGLCDKCNRFLLSDLKAGAVLCAAAVRLSHYNVKINTPNLSDRDVAEQIENASSADLDKADELVKKIEKLCDEQDS